MGSLLVEHNRHDDAISQHVMKILGKVSLLHPPLTAMMVSSSETPRWRQNKGPADSYRIHYIREMYEGMAAVRASSPPRSSFLFTLFIYNICSPLPEQALYVKRFESHTSEGLFKAIFFGKHHIQGRLPDKRLLYHSTPPRLQDF